MEEERNKKQQSQIDQERKQVDGHEDVKIEKFFAIIRRLRDARNGSTNYSLREMEARKAAKKGKKVEHVGHVWTPSFQVEDFADITECSKPTHVAAQPSSSNKGCEKERKEEPDLNLSL